MMDETTVKDKKARVDVEPTIAKSETRKIEVLREEPSTEKKALKVKIDDACAWFGEKQALFSVNMEILAKEVTAIIGPSGCGKSTLIRCFNRMHETVPTARFTGDIRLDEQSIFAPHMDPVVVRRRIGMVFQKPTPFPRFPFMKTWSLV